MGVIPFSIMLRHKLDPKVALVLKLAHIVIRLNLTCHEPVKSEASTRYPPAG
jgi:hypothetical protein